MKTLVTALPMSERWECSCHPRILSLLLHFIVVWCLTIFPRIRKAKCFVLARAIDVAISMRMAIGAFRCVVDPRGRHSDIGSPPSVRSATGRDRHVNFFVCLLYSWQRQWRSCLFEIKRRMQQIVVADQRIAPVSV